jgi:phosphoribosylamine--glycine ligase
VRGGFSVGIVLTTPPFPYPRSQVQEPVGLPVIFDGELSDEDRHNLHFCELGLEAGQLVTTGIYGWTMVVTGTGDTIALAQRRANALADRVLVPNVRYRRDIGARLIADDYARIEALDLLD